MNFGVLLLIIIIGIIFGIIGGALWLVIKVILSQKKAMKDFKSKRMMEVKNSPKEKVEKLDVPKPIEENKDKSALSKLFENKKCVKEKMQGGEK